MTDPIATRRVLVVDDDDTIRVLVMTMLRRSGFEAEGAASGAEALSLIGNRHYDAILLDLMMPLMSGFDVLASLMKSGRPYPRVIIMSAAPREVIAETGRMKVAGTIQKPFRLERVIETVKAAIATEESESRMDLCVPDARLTVRSERPLTTRSDTLSDARPGEAHLRDGRDPATRSDEPDRD